MTIENNLAELKVDWNFIFGWLDSKMKFRKG